MAAKEKIAIIGGGVSGVTLASEIKYKYDVTIFEREEKVLTKLLKTGNGKANIYNRGILPNHYNDPVFMTKHAPLIEKTLDSFFAKHKLVTFTDDANRVYPYSRSAKALRVFFVSNLDGVNVLTNTNVAEITPQDQGYKVNGHYFDQVVIATGSSAGLFKYDLMNNNEQLFKKVTSNISPFVPVIKTIKVKENLSVLENKRAEAILKLFADGKLIRREKGEVLFKKDGLSGIVSFIISSYVEWEVRNGAKKVVISLDFMPEYSEKEVRKIFDEGGNLKAIFAEELTRFLMNQKSDNLVNLIKDFKVNVIPNNNPENTQAMSGGVNVSALAKDSFKLSSQNIFILGEALNIDGICGGYNLAFAFYSALHTASALLDKKCQ